MNQQYYLLISYEPKIDINELVTVTDVMNEYHLGPNAALIYCMDYLLDNMEWFESKLNQFKGK